MTDDDQEAPADPAPIEPGTSATPRSRSWAWFGAGLLTGILGCAMVVNATKSSGQDDGGTSRPATRPIDTTPPGPTDPPPEWEVDCPGSSLVQVIYNGDGSAPYGSYTASMPDGTKQGDFDTPLTNRSGTKGLRFCTSYDDFLYFSVQNGTDSGTISCSISVDGIEVASNESNGGYMIASCEGR